MLSKPSILFFSPFPFTLRRSESWQTTAEPDYSEALTSLTGIGVYDIQMKRHWEQISFLEGGEVLRNILNGYCLGIMKK